MIQAYDQRYIWFLFHPVNRYTFVTAIKLIKNIVAMKSLLYKWLFIGLIWMSNVSFLPHPCRALLDIPSPFGEGDFVKGEIG